MILSTTWSRQTNKKNPAGINLSLDTVMNLVTPANSGTQALQTLILIYLN